MDTTYTYSVGVGVKQSVTLRPRLMDISRSGIYETFINYDEIISVGVGFEAINLKLMFIPFGFFFLWAGVMISMGKQGLVFLGFILAGLLALGMNSWFKKNGREYIKNDDPRQLPTAQSMIVIGTTRKHVSGRTRGYLIPYRSNDEQSQALLAALKSKFPTKYKGIDFMQQMFAKTGTTYVVRRAWKRKNGDYFESDRNHNRPAGTF